MRRKLTQRLLSLPPLSLSPGYIQTNASHIDAAVSLQLLSEASGLESGAKRSDEELYPPVQTIRPRTRVKYNVDVVAGDEDEGDYGSFSSGEVRVKT